MVVQQFGTLYKITELLFTTKSVGDKIFLFNVGKLYFKISGWKFVGSFDNAPDKYIAIVMPHTANFDFILGVLSRAQLNIKNARYLGKSQLFRPPYGFIFRWLGGYPVDRTKDNNLVDAVVRIFNDHDCFAVAIAPEGTRSKVKRLKTGFYHIARKANVAIIAVAFDFKRKEVVIDKPFYATDSIEKDFAYLADFYDGKEGKYPNLGLDRNIFEATVTSAK